MSATATPPAPAPAKPAAAPAAPSPNVGSAVPSSQGEIKVSQMSQQTPATPPAGSAKSKMFEALRGKAKNMDSSQGAGAPSAPELKPANVPGSQEGDPGISPEDNSGISQEGEPATAPVDPKTGKPVEKKKVNPWNLLKEREATLAQKEKEIADVKKLLIDPEVRKTEAEKWAAIEKRNQELEDHIKFVEYSKSKEYQEKYEKPYEDGWARVMSELKDVSISDPQSGDDRLVSPNDILQLVNMPLNKATELAKEIYGDMYPTILGFRSELRNLFQAKSQALEKARTEGAAKMKADAEMSSTKHAELQKFVSTEFQEAHKQVTEDPVVANYFKPVDGNDEINQSLEKGFKFFDDVMSKNPFDPNLSEEDRKKVVKMHAAVRARAAGFGRIRKELEAERAAHEETKKKLKEFESSEPDTSSGGGGSGPELGTGRKIDSMFQSLRKIAK